MSASTDPDRKPEISSPRTEEIGRVRLRRTEPIIAGCVLVVLVLFYAGPFLIQATLNRRPPGATVRAAAMAGLPRSLHVGEWHDIKSVSLSYRRKTLTDWQEDLVASGEWQVEVVFSLRQKTDLFHPDDFAARARATRDDSVEFAAAMQQTARLSSTSGLPSIPSEPLLFARASAAGEESTTKVEFAARRWSTCWLGPSPASCWRCWSGLLGESGGWSIGSTLPTIEAPRIGADIQRLRTRAELPNGALVTGEPSVEKAIADYHSARTTYIAAVQREFAKQKLSVLNDALRAEVERQVAAKFYPVRGWSINSVESITPPSQSSERRLEKPIQILLRRTEALYKVATPEETGRAIAPSAEFDEARKTAEEFFPGVASAWPQTPRLYVVAKSRGEVAKFVITVRARDEGMVWTLDQIAWPESDIVTKKPETGLPASEIAGENIFLDEAATGLPAPGDWLRRRDEMIAAVRTEEKKVSYRFGNDRAAWRILFKAFAAAGGESRLRQAVAFTEQVRTKMEWPWLFGTRPAESSGSIQWKAQPFGVDERLNVTFRFKPLLAGEETIAFTTIVSTDTASRRSETMNAFAITSTERTAIQGSRDFAASPVHRYYLNRVYAAHLLWHLAVDGGSFDVRAGGSASNLIVRAPGYPEFQLELDPASGTIHKVNYSDSIEAAKPLQVCWQLDWYRSFSGITTATRREVLVNGKRDWLYEITDVQYQTTPISEAAPTGRQAQAPTDYQIKSDLLGYSIGKGYESWKFEDVGEFRGFTIRSRQGDQTSLTYQIQVSLMGRSNIGGTAELIVRYKNQNGTWVLNGVDDRGTYRRQY